MRGEMDLKLPYKGCNYHSHQNGLTRRRYHESKVGLLKFYGFNVAFFSLH